MGVDGGEIDVVFWVGLGEGSRVKWLRLWVLGLNFRWVLRDFV